VTSEVAAQNPLRDVVRHTFVYGSGYVTMAVASFVLVPIYTHHLSPSGYGLLGLMLALYGLMTQIYDFGITNSVGRFFFDTPAAERDLALLRLRATALAFVVGFGGMLTLTLWLFAGEWSSLLTQSSSHANLVRIVAVTLYAEGLASVPLTMIRMQERSRVFVAITIARFVVTLTLSVLFVVGFGWGVRGALLANAASAIAVLLVLIPDYRKALRGRPALSLLREMASFGLPFFPVILSAWFIEASDRYLLGLYRSHAEVGYYVLGYKVAQIMQIALAAFTMGWAPLRYKIHERSDARQLYRSIATYYVLLAGMLTVAIGVFARELVALISPASYASAASIVPLIALGYALNGLYILMVTGMGIAKKTVPMAWVVGGAAVTNVGINVWLIPLWGMRAAALTTVLANAIMVAGGWYYSQRVYPIPYEWGRIIRTVVIGAVVVAAVAFLAPGHGVIGIAAAALAWALFVALLVKTATIRSEETAAVRDTVRRFLRGARRRWNRPRVA
jgi:O-antigen/teichoic acid export membrane protein